MLSCAAVIGVQGLGVMRRHAHGYQLPLRSEENALLVPKLLSRLDTLASCLLPLPT
jgi:hypothetical protein